MAGVGILSRFLIGLLIVQTTALKLRPKLPEYLITPRGTDPSLFAVILGVLFGCLAVLQILSNRSLLERALVSAQAERYSWRDIPDVAQNRFPMHYS
jgi:hypothetical protein